MHVEKRLYFGTWSFVAWMSMKDTWVNLSDATMKLDLTLLVNVVMLKNKSSFELPDCTEAPGSKPPRVENQGG